MSANEERPVADTVLILERLASIENKIAALEEKVLKGVKIAVVEMGRPSPSVIVPNAYGGPPPKVRG